LGIRPRRTCCFDTAAADASSSKYAPRLLCRLYFADLLLLLLVVVSDQSDQGHLLLLMLTSAPWLLLLMLLLPVPVLLLLLLRQLPKPLCCPPSPDGWRPCEGGDCC
jgi:hypothetical protein